MESSQPSSQPDGNDGKDCLKLMRQQLQDDLLSFKDTRQQIQDRIENRRLHQHHLLSSLQSLVPNLVSSLDLSLQLISSFNGRSYIPNPNHNLINASENRTFTPRCDPKLQSLAAKPSSDPPQQPRRSDGDKKPLDDDGDADPLSVVRSMVAFCLLERVPFTAVGSVAVLRKLEGDPSATQAEKAALLELGGEAGPISAVEIALRAIAEGNAGVELEDFGVTGKSMVMVLGIDRNRLVKELPESSQQPPEGSLRDGNLVPPQGAPTAGIDVNGGVFRMGGAMPRLSQEMWLGPDHHMSGLPPMFPGSPAPVMGPRGGQRVTGSMGIPRVIAPLHRPPLGPTSMVSPNSTALKASTEEDDMKDVEALLNKKTFRELQQSKTGEELHDLIHRPTAKETAVAAKFKTKGGSQLKEYCLNLTKEDCRRQSVLYTACDKVHFRRIIAPHTDISLGDCSFLDTCCHMKTCKYVHYELDPTPDMPVMGATPPPKPIKSRRAEYCSEVELGEAQWINCDIRTFRMDILGQFGVIMADPPWDIHMELPYGTMADDEMQNLNVPALQTDGLIFLWVTGRAMELGRECLELWGYKRIEELIWVKTNQLQRIIRTGRTGHWLNHSKEHCLVGIKGNPEVNRNIDTDVIVAEVQETSHKPDEMYPMLERISPRTRKLELFARMHNTHAGWMSLGNQLNGVRLVDEGL